MSSMNPGKWYITIAGTDEIVRGPFDTDREANLVRAELENRKDDINLWVTMRDKKTPEPENTQWYASTNAEHFTTGPFSSREDAIKEMLAEDETRFWTGRGVRLTLEDLVNIDLDNLEERATEVGYDVVGEYIEGWKLGITNKESCQKVINWTVIRILRDHGVCDPDCYRVVDVQKYDGAEVESKTDGPNS